LNTNNPDPVSSLITPASSLEVVAENAFNLLEVYVTVPPAPKLIVEESVPLNDNVLLIVNILLSAIDKVEPVATAVIVSLLIVVAVAAPSVGETNVGALSNTNLPVPVAPVLVIPSIVG
jgi:hypothetical protein